VAKARVDFCGTYGAAKKAAPFQKEPQLSFSAICEAERISGDLRHD
jgi:hypothetical protein